MECDVRSMQLWCTLLSRASVSDFPSTRRIHPRPPSHPRLVVRWQSPATGTKSNPGYSPPSMAGWLFDIVQLLHPISQREYARRVHASTSSRSSVNSQLIILKLGQTRRTASSGARAPFSSRFIASGSMPSREFGLFSRRFCITWCFVNFQYPVVASIEGGCGAVSCSHSRTTTSSDKSREACMMACASVELGVYGFSAMSAEARG